MGLNCSSCTGSHIVTVDHNNQLMSKTMTVQRQSRTPCYPKSLVVSNWTWLRNSSSSKSINELHFYSNLNICQRRISALPPLTVVLIKSRYTTHVIWTQFRSLKYRHKARLASDQRHRAVWRKLAVNRSTTDQLNDTTANWIVRVCRHTIQ